MDATSVERPAPASAGAERDLWLTLAAAFLALLHARTAAAFRAVLAEDIEALARAVGLAAGDAIGRLRLAIGQLPDDTALRVDYAHLFLPPAGVATLNLTRYVDTGIGGACMDAIELAYATHGLAPADGLHDLPDHAARQFECMAWLCDRGDLSAAEEFANLCLVGALPRLAAQLGATAADHPEPADRPGADGGALVGHQPQGRAGRHRGRQDHAAPRRASSPPRRCSWSAAAN